MSDWKIDMQRKGLIFYRSFLSVRQHLYAEYDFPTYYPSLLNVRGDNARFKSEWSNCAKFYNNCEARQLDPIIVCYAYLRDKSLWLPDSFSPFITALSEWDWELARVHKVECDVVDAYLSRRISLSTACENYDESRVYIGNDFDRQTNDLIVRHMFYHKIKQKK